MEFPVSPLPREDRARLDLFLGSLIILALVGWNLGSTQFINKFSIAYLSLLFPHVIDILGTGFYEDDEFG